MFDHDPSQHSGGRSLTFEGRVCICNHDPVVRIQQSLVVPCRLRLGVRCYRSMLSLAKLFRREGFEATVFSESRVSDEFACQNDHGRSGRDRRDGIHGAIANGVH